MKHRDGELFDKRLMIEELAYAEGVLRGLCVKDACGNADPDGLPGPLAYNLTQVMTTLHRACEYIRKEYE